MQVLFSSILFLFSYNTSQKPLPLVLTLLAAMATLFSIAYSTAFIKLWNTTDSEMAAIVGMYVELEEKLTNQGDRVNVPYSLPLPDHLLFYIFGHFCI